MTPTVHHLGRAGDVPGGMTQVVNGYLAWDFPDVDVAVITSRGDPHDLPAAVRHAVGALRAVLRLPRGDVVVAHLSERGSFLREGSLMRLARLRGLGTVAHLHGASFAAFADRFPALSRWVLRGADRVVTLSDETGGIVARWVPAARISLVPNAIPAGDARDKTDTVVFGGVITRRKGVDVLLAAWEALGATDGWRLLVAGPVVDADVVRAVRGVEFLGPLPHDELMTLLDHARVAVLPSRDEAMPMFILEAMARDACVVATAVGGVGPVLADGRGLVVPAADAAALTEALATAIQDGARREATAALAAERFRTTYAADAVFPRMQAVWLGARDDALGRRTAGSPAAA